MQGEASSLSHYPFVIFCAPERKSPVMEVETLLEDALREKKNVLRMRVKFFFVTVFPVTCLKHLSSMFKSNMETLALISTELRYQPSGKSLAVTWPTGSVVLTPAGVVICLCKCAVCPKLALLAFCPYELQLLCAYSNGWLHRRSQWRQHSSCGAAMDAITTDCWHDAKFAKLYPGGCATLKMYSQSTACVYMRDGATCVSWKK